MPDAVWTGHLARAPDGDGWAGLLTDPYGWVLRLTGEVETVDGVRQVKLTAALGETPEQFVRKPVA